MAFNQSGTLAGLGTYGVAVPAAGVYVVDGKVSLPKIVDGDTAASSVVVVVKLNSDAATYTGTAGADGFKCDIVAAAAGDVINVITSSAASVDQGLNVIKTTIAISSGVA